MLHLSPAELQLFAILYCPALVITTACFASLLWRWRRGW
jgi:hypothetical protein